MDGASKGLFIGQVFADFQFANLGVEGGGFEIQQFGCTPFSADTPLVLSQSFQDVIPFHLFE